MLRVYVKIYNAEQRLSSDIEAEAYIMATETKANSKVNTGTISQVVGVVVDVDFPGKKLPEIYNALTVELDGVSWCWKLRSI